jgi:hypothetical protein
MIQIEIFEYNQKLSDIYNKYYHIFELDINSHTQVTNSEKNKEIFDFDENLKYKFQLIKQVTHPTIAKYIDFKKEESKKLYKKIFKNF